MPGAAGAERRAARRSCRGPAPRVGGAATSSGSVTTAATSHVRRGDADGRRRPASLCLTSSRADRVAEAGEQDHQRRRASASPSPDRSTPNSSATPTMPIDDADQRPSRASARLRSKRTASSAVKIGALATRIAGQRRGHVVLAEGDEQERADDLDERDDGQPAPAPAQRRRARRRARRAAASTAAPSAMRTQTIAPSESVVERDLDEHVRRAPQRGERRPSGSRRGGSSDPTVGSAGPSAASRACSTADH